MRESDRREIYATRASDDPEDVARQCNASPYKWVYRQDDALVAAFGAAPLWPGVWSIWMFANDLWDAEAARAVVRHVRREFRRHPWHRLECKSLLDHHDAHRFIAALGLRPEALHRSYGRDGEDFITFARVLKM
jgi:hypothetical protein